VRALDPVVLRLRSVGVARQAALLAQRGELVATASEDLVDIALVAGVEDDRVPWRVEDAMDRDRQFHDAQVGTEMPAGTAHARDQEGPDLRSQLVELSPRQPPQGGWIRDPFQQ